MNILRLQLLGCLLLITFCTQAQWEAKPWKDYHQPNFRIIYWNINPTAGGGDQQPLSFASSDEGKVGNFSLNNGIGINYFSRKLVYSLDTDINGSYSYLHEKNEQEGEKTWSGDLGIDFHSSWFLGNSDFHVPLDYKADLESFKRNKMHFYDENLTGAEHSQNVFAGLGYGRLERVTSMMNSIQLFEALRRNGFAVNPPGDMELKELTIKMDSLIYRRVWDGRNQRKAVLKELALLLEPYVEADLIDLVVELNDVFFLSQRNARYKGARIAIQAGYSTYNRKSDGESEYKYEDPIIRGELSYHLPINWKWHWVSEAVLYKRYSDISTFTFVAGSRISWDPDTRNRFSLLSNFSYTDVDVENWTKRVSLKLVAGYNCFISPRLAGYVNLTLSRIDLSETKDSTPWNANAGIRYQLW